MLSPFCRPLSLASLLLILLPATACLADATPDRKPDHKPDLVADLGNPSKHLLIDPRVIAQAEGVRLVLGAIEKETAANPLLPADRPWENSLNNLYPNVIYDADEKLFKMWYKCVLVDREVIAKMKPPRTTHDVGWYVCYATSKDGVKWQKPELGLIDHDGTTKNNIVARDAPNVGVFRCDHDADPKRRYKLISDVGMGKIQFRFSPDGLRWSDPVPGEGLGNTGDTHNNAFWDPSLGKYVLFTRYYFGERLVARTESKDFKTWETPKVVLRSTLEEGKKRQSYCMCVFRYGSGYIGLLMMYNVGADRTVDCELAYSPDSVSWQRILPGQALIPRGAKDSYDGGCIYAQANPPILRDGRLHIFYGGSKATHVGWKRHCLPCLARLRLDGFAAYSSVGDKAGSIVSQPMLCTGEPLKISADAKGGALRVSVVGEDDYTLDACETITGDVSDSEVRWRGGKSLAALKGKVVQLRFDLDRAKLYSFSGLRLLPKPSIEPEHRRFKDSLEVKLSSPSNSRVVIRYTLDGSEPTERSTMYRTPIKISETTTLKSRVFLPDAVGGGPIERTKFERSNPGPGTGERRIIEHEAGFTLDAGGWTAVDRAERMTEAKRSFLRVSRAKHSPFIVATEKVARGAFVGDLQNRYQGIGLDIRLVYRSSAGSAPLLELFAGDIAPWSYHGWKAVGKEWQTYRTQIRYDWSDAEAKAAGWRPAQHGFSWQETMKNVGQVVIIEKPTSSEGTFDLELFRMASIYE
jgi:hypothetical protein